MCVRVGETWEDRPAAPVDALGVGVLRHELRRRSERGDAPVAHQQCGVVEDRASLVGGDDRRVVDQLLRRGHAWLLSRGPRQQSSRGIVRAWTLGNAGHERGGQAMRDLVKRLEELSDRAEFDAGWYLKDLATGATANRRGDVPVPSASTRKISIMMAALAAVHAGKLSLDQKVTIDAKYQDNDSGTFQHLTPGFWLTLRDHLVMMIIVSDNTCTGTVVDQVGLENVRRYTEAVGLTGTIHRYGIPPKTGPDNTLDRVTTTTPNDQGLLLEQILKGTTDAAVAARLQCTTALCRLGLDILSWQKLKTRLPSLLPLGTKVAHKTGTGFRCYNDAGIIFKGDRPLFILSAYTSNVPETLKEGTPGFAGAYQLIGRMARLAWDDLGR